MIMRISKIMDNNKKQKEKKICEFMCNIGWLLYPATYISNGYRVLQEENLCNSQTDKGTN